MLLSLSLLLNPFMATDGERADPRHTSISCQFDLRDLFGSDKKRDAASTPATGVRVLGSCPEN